MTEPALRLRDVFCVHRTADGDAAALQGLSLELEAGDRGCVVGPSGAGKTTLLRVIAGLQQPSAGSVLVFGRDPGRLSPRDRARFRHDWIGLLDQRAERTLCPDLTAAESIALPLRLRGHGHQQRRTRVGELLEAAGLSDRGAALPSQLSGGERQRIALCAAIAHRPRLLLADEPTAELDPRAASAVAELINTLARETGTTVLIVSHDVALAAHAQRAFELHEGRIAQARNGTDSALVVGRGGWVRLPAPLLAESGIDGSAHIQPVRDGLLLTPARDPAPTGGDRETGVTATVLGPAVGLHGLTKQRDGRPVLDGLTFTCPASTMTVVTGPSGVGKTTLLDLIAGLELPDGGALSLGEQQLTALSHDQRAELRRTTVGYLTQEPSPIDFLSALENVVLGLRLRGDTAPEAEPRARAALIQLGLGDRIDQRIERLSAGEAQRVALAAAIASGPALVIADEPTSRLDRRAGATVSRALGELVAGGATVICATHDPDLVAQADQILNLGQPRA